MGSVRLAVYIKPNTWLSVCRIEGLQGYETKTLATQFEV